VFGLDGEIAEQNVPDDLFIRCGNQGYDDGSAILKAVYEIGFRIAAEGLPVHFQDWSVVGGSLFTDVQRHQGDMVSTAIRQRPGRGWLARSWLGCCGLFLRYDVDGMSFTSLPLQFGLNLAETVRTTRQDLLGEGVPPVLYHYTNLGGILGIGNSCALHAISTEDSKDQTEIDRRTRSRRDRPPFPNPVESRWRGSRAVRYRGLIVVWRWL